MNSLWTPPVVGLHPNTFKPHTGTKTSVLFVQKYTPEQIARITQVQQDVAGACPDHDAQIKALLERHQTKPRERAIGTG